LMWFLVFGVTSLNTSEAIMWLVSPVVDNMLKTICVVKL
jgi:hypothetical protein